ncbi:glycosyltransferase [Lentzea sp. NBRC 102530]|uniref:glycosyltransferase family 2 protein n=1 Tax=Lentzea sp. NBRC 102530 TaxID=3032201 RepID=UPI0024A5F7E8|nr:glycosyltransferase [Lentzea sp. NBRC 102530]GLY50391.1 glycosyl transferase [Lentzea sp. NBRC 102530]
MSLWVVVPAYNEERSIVATLRALAAQEDLDFRLVVVDNGSTDSTVDLVRRFHDENPELRLEVVHEPQKGTGAAADTGMRHAIAQGARWLARTDADCLPAPDWTARVKAAFGSGLRLVSGQLLPRTDEGVRAVTRWVLVAAVEVASAFGKVRSGNRDPRYLGPYVMTPGCNMAITAELYVLAGGFPRSKIEDLHEDRALVNAVRLHTTAYGRRRDVVVHGSSRRAQAWGLRRTLAWYADHRYRPDVVDIR